MISYVEAFCCKLNLFKECLNKNQLVHFPCCKKILTEFPELKFDTYSVNITDILESYNKRFECFNQIKPYSQLFFSPMSCKIIDQPDDLQMELCNMQTDLH